MIGNARDVEDILQEQMLRAIDILKKNEKEWKLVTDAVVEHEELSRQEFLKVMSGEDISKKNKWFWQSGESPEVERKPLPLPPKVEQKPRSYKQNSNGW